MLDKIPMADLVLMLSNKHTVSTKQGRTTHIALYKANSIFVCKSDKGDIRLSPMSLRLTCDSRLLGTDTNVMQASIICSTTSNVADLLGTPICVFSNEFEMYGRLRFAKCHRLFHPYTGTNYMALAIASITSLRQCGTCTRRPVNKSCDPGCMSEHKTGKTR